MKNMIDQTTPGISIDPDVIPEDSPSPWHKSYIDTPEGISDCDFYITDANGYTVCKCVFVYGDHIKRMKDANVMVAAPELLSALETLLDAHEWEQFSHVSAEFVRAQDAAEVAIRKAKGE